MKMITEYRIKEKMKGKMIIKWAMKKSAFPWFGRDDQIL